MRYYVDKFGNKCFYQLLSNDHFIFARVNGYDYSIPYHYCKDYVWKVNKKSVSSNLKTWELVSFFEQNPVYFSATMQALFPPIESRV